MLSNKPTYHKAHQKAFILFYFHANIKTGHFRQQINKDP